MNKSKRALQRERHQVIMDLLKGIRINKGLSKNWVLKISEVDVSKYESGKCTPKLESITSLCEAYDIDIILFWMACRACQNNAISLKCAVELLIRKKGIEQALEVIYNMFLKTILKTSSLLELQ